MKTEVVGASPWGWHKANDVIPQGGWTNNTKRRQAPEAGGWPVSTDALEQAAPYSPRTADLSAAFVSWRGSARRVQEGMGSPTQPAPS